MNCLSTVPCKAVLFGSMELFDWRQDTPLFLIIGFWFCVVLLYGYLKERWLKRRKGRAVPDRPSVSVKRIDAPRQRLR